MVGSPLDNLPAVPRSDHARSFLPAVGKSWEERHQQVLCPSSCSDHLQQPCLELYMFQEFMFCMNCRFVAPATLSGHSGEGHRPGLASVTIHLRSRRILYMSITAKATLHVLEA